MGIRETPMVYREAKVHANKRLNMGGGSMAVQLRKRVDSNEVVPVAGGVGYAKPSLEVLSCCTCNVEGSCLARQLTKAHEHSYQVVKNRKELSRGNHIFRGGDEAEALYVVSSGSIKSYMLMEDGEEQVLNFYMPGDVFGLDAMRSKHHVSSTIALEPTRVCKLPLSEIQGRALGQDFLNMISDNMLREHNLMLMLARKDADGRLASFLLDMLKRTEAHGSPTDTIELTMTRQDIANHLGLVIETVSRAFRRFQDSGILEVSRRSVKIYNFDYLLRVAGTQVTG